jgi:hypothetical protein
MQFEPNKVLVSNQAQRIFAKTKFTQPETTWFAKTKEQLFNQVPGSHEYVSIRHHLSA